jgi:hypothetical protein
MRYAVTLLFLATAIATVAGDTDSLKVKPVRYVFTLNSSVLFCGSCTTESSTVALPTTIHGIRWRQLRVGAGIGYTSFGPIRVMPYFGSVMLSLYGKKRQQGVFVEFNYGAAHAWLAPPVRNGDFLKDVTASSFSQLSAGYAFHYHGLRLAAQVGVHSLITERTMEYGQGYYYPYGTMDNFVPPRHEFIEYETTRLFLTISIGI